MKNLKRIVLTLVMVFAIIMPSIVFAETIEVKTEDELKAVLATGGEAKVTENFEVTKDLYLVDGKKVTIDLNNHDILFKNQTSINIDGGTLDLKGTGSMKNDITNFSPIYIKGSKNKEDVNYSNVTVGKDVHLKGHMAIIVVYPDNDNKYVSYGVNVNVYGTLEGDLNTKGVEGSSIQINGNIRNTENCPVFNIYSSAKLIGNTDGIYGAGYAIWNIDGATIEGVTSGIATKAGIWNIKNAKITATGEKTDSVGQGEGIKGTGSAIQIESHPSFYGHVEMTIDGGEYSSSHNAVIQHYLADSATEGALAKPIIIKGGTFYGTLDMMKADEIEISGGSFTDEIVAKKGGVKLVTGVKAVKAGSLYTIVSENKGELVVTDPEVKVSDKVDEKVAKELTDAKLTDTVTGLKDAIDSSKIEGVENTLIEVKMSTEIKSYDKEKGVLVLDIKPYYIINQEAKVLPNEAITGKIKVKVAVPNEITFTHAKVVHKNGETVIDTKEYEIKEENGQKYIEIETESFSTFELSFYTPEKTETKDNTDKVEKPNTTNKVENPNTVDGILVYTSVTLMSLALLGATALILKKKMN